MDWLVRLLSFFTIYLFAVFINYDRCGTDIKKLYHNSPMGLLLLTNEPPVDVHLEKTFGVSSSCIGNGLSLVERRKLGRPLPLFFH